MRNLKLEPLEARDVPSGVGLYAIGNGPGGTPRVQVFRTSDNSLVGDFQAFEATFTGGVNVAIADVTNDGNPDVIVGAGRGGGPRVRVFDGRAFITGTIFPAAPRNNTLISPQTVVADFFAFEIAQRGGVYVTGGNLGGSAHAEVIVGAGPGGGPRVRAFDGAAITIQARAFNTLQIGDVRADFFAFESSFRNGVTLSASPGLPGTIAQFLAVAPGAGGAPRVRLLNGPAIAAQGTTYNTLRPGDVFSDFFAGDSNSRAGAFVTTADLTADGFVDVAVGTGAGPIGTVTVYNGIFIQNAGLNFTGFGPQDVFDRLIPAGNNYTNGVTVGNAPEVNNPTSSLLLIGFGGQDVVGRAQVSRYQPPADIPRRQIVNEINFDGGIHGVFVSN